MNINLITGIAFGYISANALDPEIIDQMQFGSQANNVTYDSAWDEFLESKRRDYIRMGLQDSFDDDQNTIREQFNHDYESDEEVHEGKIEVPGYGFVEYRTSWLGGALNVWILKSPFMTDKARRASPCVPDAGILDTLDGSVTAYDVPADWRIES